MLFVPVADLEIVQSLGKICSTLICKWCLHLLGVLLRYFVLPGSTAKCCHALLLTPPRQTTSRVVGPWVHQRFVQTGNYIMYTTSSIPVPPLDMLQISPPLAPFLPAPTSSPQRVWNKVPSLLYSHL
jgi:hypothetical protein